MREKKELLSPDLHEVSVNNLCYVDLTPAGLKRYQRHYEEIDKNFVLLQKELFNQNTTVDPKEIWVPKLETTEVGTRFQVWNLMYIFGSMFSIDSDGTPFNSVTIDLRWPKSPQETPEKQKIGVNDLIYLNLTADDKRFLIEKLCGYFPFQTEGSFTKIPFDKTANLFQEEMWMGSQILLFEGNKIYLPTKQ